MSRIRPEAQALLDRLSRMDPGRPHLDKVLVERAIAAHLAALGLHARPVHWCDDADEAGKRLRHDERWLVRGMHLAAGILTITVTWFWFSTDLPPLDDPLTIAVILLIAYVQLTVLFSFAFIFVRVVIWLIFLILRLFPPFRTHEDWFAETDRWVPRIPAAAARASNDAVLLVALEKTHARIWESARAAADLAPRHRPRVAAHDAAAAVLAANGSAIPDGTERCAAILNPLLDAFEAGLWLYWVTRRDIICVPAPSLAIVDNRLHADRGPALHWPNGTAWHFWRGVRVPAWVIEEPDRISVETITKESNLERRRCMIEIYGRERFLADAGARLIHRDAFGTLWEVSFPDAPWRLVEVVNGTPEPDGRFRNYVLDITGAAEMLGWRINTAHAAVAATYGLRPEQYRPDVRT